jgi:hypothetical protein
MFGLKRDEATETGGKVHRIRSFIVFYFSTDTNNVIKLRMRSVGRIAHMEETINAYKIACKT